MSDSVAKCKYGEVRTAKYVKKMLVQKETTHVSVLLPLNFHHWKVCVKKKRLSRIPGRRCRWKLLQGLFLSAGGT